MTDSHAQLEAWLVDGALGDPPREIAVHATLCESCTARLGAFDALALIDVAAAGSPPLLAAPTRLRKGVASARLATAVVGTVVAGILLVFGVSQLVGLGGPAGDPAGGPEGTELAGLSTASDQGGPVPSRQELSSIAPEATETSTSSVPATAQPGFTPGPLPSLPPAAPPPTPVPTPIPSVPAPTPTPTPAPTVPDAPILTALAGIGIVDLSWTVPADGGSPITGYDIYRNDVLLQLGWSGTSFNDSGLTAGNPYSYYVTAVNAVGAGAASNTETATPTPSPSPSPSPSL